MADQNHVSHPIPFKAETRQLLDILIHSLYTEREIFLRELISNASDALTRLDFENLTNRDILDPDVELAIYINFDKEKNTLTIRDTGIGMTADELSENLGTIAHSGARAFVSAAQSDSNNMNDIIGQFGVGFYSAFMVADSIWVTSRSYLPCSQAATWICSGEDTYTIQPSEQQARGTIVTLHLKKDASEFLQEPRLHEIIRHHSDFVSFPIYLSDKPTQVNRQIALWRQPPRKVGIQDYEEFYRQLTLDPTPLLAYSHISIDAPVQIYAILFLPALANRGPLSRRKDDGLKLYSRKILIQEYCKDLLPQYLRFIQGVVDSEDLPLNVARETYQVNRVITQIKSLITSKAIDMLTKLAADKPEEYNNFWKEYSAFLKEGITLETTDSDALYPLLRFRSTTYPDGWISLNDYCSRLKPTQNDIYYLLGEDVQSISQSPHLEYLRKQDFEVLLLVDPIDTFLMIRFDKYKDHPLVNIAVSDLNIPQAEKNETVEDVTSPVDTSPERWVPVIQCFQSHLGDKVASVRMTDRLSDSPARLVDPEGTAVPGLQRVYRYLKEDYEIPKKVLELNPSHPIIQAFSSIPENDELGGFVIDQIYENALLIEGLHPNPANMINRINQIIQAALKR